MVPRFTLFHPYSNLTQRIYVQRLMEETASKHKEQFQLENQGTGESQQQGQGGEKQNKVEAQLQPDEGKCFLLVHGNSSHRHFDELYDKPLLCFGCGIGWFCFVLGFAFPLLWYIATALYIGKFHLRDPRERAGLAASAIAALVCSVAALTVLLAVIF